MPQPRMADMVCRLCGKTARYSFSREVLYKHQVAYLECESCHSLQTEPPYWISDAYSSNLAALDTGAAQRNLANLAATYAVARAMKLKNILDFGGGDGLLCRLLRDYEINCFVNDKYANATYAQAFATPDFTRPDIVLAFEVFEHFENPLADLGVLFEFKPDVLITSTSIFEGQNSDWWYLTPETGQHIFFYSRAALKMIAERFGYTVLFCSGYILFVRPGLAGPLRTAALRFSLHKISLRVVSAVMRLLPTRGAWKDFIVLRDRERLGP